nr:MAG TPA: hypothetical protein [Caudoviricetes sp.]
MTGYIKIFTTTRNGRRGLEVQTEVQNVFFMDRMQVLDALCRSFNVSLNELEMFVALKSRGIMDKAVTVEHLKDEHVKGPSADPLEQLLNAMMGGDDK